MRYTSNRKIVVCAYITELLIALLCCTMSVSTVVKLTINQSLQVPVESGFSKTKGFNLSRAELLLPTSMEYLQLMLCGYGNG